MNAQTTTDAVDLLRRSLEQLGQVIDRIAPDQLELPTPCPEWNVDDLIEHVISEIPGFAEKAGAPALTAEEAEMPDLSGSAAERFRRAADALLAAWRAADLEGTREHPGMGVIPKRWPVDQQAAEFAIHAWDLANATGQPTDGLDPEVGEASLTWLKATLKPEWRGRSFGPEVTAPDAAPLYDRIAAFAGRTP